MLDVYSEVGMLPFYHLEPACPIHPTLTRHFCPYSLHSLIHVTFPVTKIQFLPPF